LRRKAHAAKQAQREEKSGAHGVYFLEKTLKGKTKRIVATLLAGKAAASRVGEKIENFTFE
jgi:hypothetical protein